MLHTCNVDVSLLLFLLLLQFDREHFSEVFVDLKWFESKVGNKYLNEAAGLAAEQDAASKAADKQACPPATAAQKPGDEEEEDEDLFETEFRQYKRTYYMTKMGVDVVSE